MVPVHITSLGKLDSVQRSLFTIRSKHFPKQNNLIMLRGGKVRCVHETIFSIVIIASLYLPHKEKKEQEEEESLCSMHR